MDSNSHHGSVAQNPQLDRETLERLHRTTNELYASSSIEACTRHTVTAAIDILGFDWCVILTTDESTGQFEIVATAGETSLSVGDRSLDIGEGVVGAVFETGTPEIVNDTATAHDIEPPNERIASAITVPIEDWGVFQALGTEPDAFDETDLRLLELLVTPLATTIERIETETALRTQKEVLVRQKRQIEELHTVSTMMKMATKHEEIHDLFVAAVEEVLDISICTLDEREGEYLKTRAVGSEMELDDFYTETPLDKTGSVATETFERGETILISDLQQTDYRAASSEYRSLISVPLGDWGVFQAATGKRDAFDETDRQLIELLADAADAAVDRIERNRELERRAAELERQNERLDKFASRLSHEMRNPLSVLATRMELARETGETDHFDHMERSIHRMSRLINDTLALAREGTVEIETGTVNLAQLASLYWDSIRTTNTELVLDTDREIYADEDRLHQLLSNLFRNAVEHAATSPAPNDDSDQVTVTIGDLSDGFYVEDDGQGIPTEHREAVLESGTSGLAHGTGLGLAVVEKVADAHGWSLTLTESEEGGARFEFRNVDFA